jgi:transposase
MSMKPQPIPEIPAETVRVVRAVFPKGNISIHLRDTLGTIYQDELFADLFPGRGQPAYARLSPRTRHCFRASWRI